jgi:Family of unknown function (DUF6087)
VGTAGQHRRAFRVRGPVPVVSSAMAYVQARNNRAEQTTSCQIPGPEGPMNLTAKAEDRYPGIFGLPHRHDRRPDRDRVPGPPVSALRCLLLSHGTDADAVITEWDGTAWVTAGVAPNADAAREFPGQVPGPCPEYGSDVRPAPPGPGRGPHRKP